MHRGLCTALSRALLGPLTHAPRLPGHTCGAGQGSRNRVERDVETRESTRQSGRMCVAPTAIMSLLSCRSVVSVYFFKNTRRGERQHPSATQSQTQTRDGNELVSSNASHERITDHSSESYASLSAVSPPLTSRTSPHPRLPEPRSLQCCTIFVVAGRPLSFSGPSMWQYLHLNSLRPLSLKIFLGSVLMPTHPSIMSTSSSESSQMPSGR